MARTYQLTMQSCGYGDGDGDSDGFWATRYPQRRMGKAMIDPKLGKKYEEIWEMEVAALDDSKALKRVVELIRAEAKTRPRAKLNVALQVVAKFAGEAKSKEKRLFRKRILAWRKLLQNGEPRLDSEEREMGIEP